MSRKRKAPSRARRSAAAGSSGTSHSHRAPHARRLACEQLEDRRLLAVVTVDVLDDSVDLADGRTSLREAIFATNTVPGADEIRFDPALFAEGPRTILLTQGELTIADVLTIKDPLTITGPGAELLTIDASGNDPTPDVNNGDGSRVFRIEGGYTNTATQKPVSLNGLTITGGDVTGDGGGIWSAATTTLSSVRVVGNAATSPHATLLDNGRGGGVFAGQPFTSLTVRDSIISGNEAGRGGGIYFLATSLIVEVSTIADNRALGGRRAGGGIHAYESGISRIQNSVIRGNYSRFGAGGAFLDGGTITHCTIIDNQGAQGGGLNLRGPRFALDSLVVADNSATANGGGIWMDSGDISTVRNSTISGNRADANGGGIYATADAIISNCTISGNLANRGGGAFQPKLTGRFLWLLHSTVTENEAVTHGGVAGHGGGVAAERLRVRNSIVSGNMSSGTSPDASSPEAIIRYSLLGDNRGVTTYDLQGRPQALPEAPVGSPDERGNLIGGPVHGVIDAMLGPLSDNGGPTLPNAQRLLTYALFPGSPAIDGGRVDIPASPVFPTPEFDQRGAPFSRVLGTRIDMGAVEQTGAPLVVDTLADESDGDYRRGDVSLREAIELANAQAGADVVEFDPKLFAAGAGTILLKHGELTVTDSLTINGPGADLLTIDASGNDPTPYVSNFDGSRALQIPGNAPFETRTKLIGLSFIGGDDGLGGAIYAPSPAHFVGLIGCTIRNNSAFLGGGIYANSLEIIGTRMFNNQAASGGAIVGGEMIILDSYIANNRATTSGGAIYYGGSATITRTEFANNFAGSDGGAINAYGALTIDACLFRGNEGVDRGGAIHHANNTLLISHSVFEDNFSSEIPNTIVGVGAKRGGEGGAVSSQGSNQLHITSSRFVRNRATGVGGGVWLSGSAITIDDTMIAANSASRDGGGLYLGFGSTLIMNSTIDGNISSRNGGGIFSDVPRVKLVHSTIANNRALTGGGIYYGRGLALSHVIVAANSSPTAPDVGRNFFATLSESSFSIIGNANGSGLAEAPVGSPDANGNLIGGPVHGVIDPLLEPLTDNGGTTLTHALLPGSPAIDAGDGALVPGIGGVPEFDQRGAPFTRVAGARIDMGAVEFQATGGALGADFNFDGRTDGHDFLAWQRNVGRTSGATIRHGDATADGDVDGNDLAVWRARYGAVSGQLSAVSQGGEAPAAAGGTLAGEEEAELAWLAFSRDAESAERSAGAAVRGAFRASKRFEYASDSWQGTDSRLGETRQQLAGFSETGIASFRHGGSTIGETRPQVDGESWDAAWEELGVEDRVTWMLR